MDMFNNFLGIANDFLYSYILIALLIITGVYFTIRSGFVQFRLLPDSIKVLKEKKSSGSVSSFGALMISTASRVGTGNIAGVATAIAVGGAGAVFWMWIMAIIGGASAFIESTLAQIYKTPDKKSFRGGPAYYIERAMKSRGLGVVFAILLILCFAYGFNALQSYTMSSAMEYYIPGYASTIFPLVIGGIIALFTALVIYGGVHRIGFITSYIVPVMAIIYIALGLFITFTNLENIPAMFRNIFNGAFDFQAIFGGFAGSVVVVGIKRGLFSNEAGMGSAPNAAATAEVSHPVKQGMVQVLSVFIDTLVICSTTAGIVLLSGTPLDGSLTGLPLVQSAVNLQVGSFGIHFVTFSIFAFAFSSIIGNYYYAESNIMFIKDSKLALNIFRASVIVVVFLGASASFDTVWNLADVLMGLMSIVNIFAMFFLGNIALKCLKNYTDQKKQGKDPVFKASDIGLDNTDCWK